jgi:lysophospholipase L1-like esterase
MKYLALGDSISIDDYTGVAGGGAAGQFAKLISATEFQDLTLDGSTTGSVLQTMALVKIKPEIVTLTAGGNDLLLCSADGPDDATAAVPEHLRVAAAEAVDNLTQIAERLARYNCPVIMNTVYDPTDGDDSLAGELGMDAACRYVFDRINHAIRSLSAVHGFLLCDLEKLFHGHGFPSAEPWLVHQVEPNHAGATAIAAQWYALFSRHCRTVS